MVKAYFIIFYQLQIIRSEDISWTTTNEFAQNLIWVEVIFSGQVLGCDANINLSINKLLL